MVMPGDASSPTGSTDSSSNFLLLSSLKLCSSILIILAFFFDFKKVNFSVNLSTNFLNLESFFLLVDSPHQKEGCTGKYHLLGTPNSPGAIPSMYQVSSIYYRGQISLVKEDTDQKALSYGRYGKACEKHQQNTKVTIGKDVAKFEHYAQNENYKEHDGKRCDEPRYPVDAVRQTHHPHELFEALFFLVHNVFDQHGDCVNPGQAWIGRHLSNNAHCLTLVCFSFHNGFFDHVLAEFCSAFSNTKPAQNASLSISFSPVLTNSCSVAKPSNLFNSMHWSEF
ncbi:hypothetical protein BpHYR1_020785 [Brachionus plicatilis]|uniref:Uncharacterized protein n=1 Tax=Brachionus plicatilis TaxID=10195 RepID=A0A3M7S829_BRAPC|nr:hypothetical protein BpHYR1_020785 [Brachionus plicatilis]